MSDRPADEEVKSQAALSGQEGEADEARHSSDQEELYENNHDLIGIEGIISAQRNEIEKKKVRLQRP